MVAKAMAWVTLIRAAFSLFCERWRAATTELPAPIISPIPVRSIKAGQQMLMAAIPSLPTPCPTKIPSTTVTAEMLTMPKRVGMKYFLNNANTLTVLRSMASL